MKDKEMSESKRKRMNKFVDELFKDNLEVESFVSLKEQIT